LSHACEQGSAKVVKALLAEGVNPNDWEGTSPLLTACVKRNLKIVKLLLQSDFDFTQNAQFPHSPLLIACGSGDTDIVQHLLEAGFDANLRASSHGETSLHLASQFGRVEIVRLLLEYGARTNEIDSKMRSPLDVARQYSHWEVVDILQLHEVPNCYLDD
ncbi:ankyrin repeat-containing domain protein, partial [Flagelloscypha sp. PMI_526]